MHITTHEVLELRGYDEGQAHIKAASEAVHVDLALAAHLLLPSTAPQTPKATALVPEHRQLRLVYPCMRAVNT